MMCVLVLGWSLNFLLILKHLLRVKYLLPIWIQIDTLNCMLGRGGALALLARPSRVVFNSMGYFKYRIVGMFVTGRSIHCSFWDRGAIIVKGMMGRRRYYMVFGGISASGLLPHNHMRWWVVSLSWLRLIELLLWGN